MKWLLVLVKWNGRRIERLIPRQPTESEWHELTNNLMPDLRSADCIEVGA